MAENDVSRSYLAGGFFAGLSAALIGYSAGFNAGKRYEARKHEKPAIVSTIPTTQSSQPTTRPSEDGLTKSFDNLK